MKREKSDQLINEAIASRDEGDLSRALTILLTIIETPPDLKVLCAMGSIYWDLGQLPEAISCLLRAIEYYPNNESAILWFFDRLSKDKELDLSAKEMEQSLIFPTTKEYELFRADFYYEYALLSSDNHQRVVLLEYATKANPDDAEAFMELGKSYKNIGEIEKAELSLKKSISINDDGMARLWLGHLFFCVGLWDLAEREFVSAQNHFPKFAAPIWGQADIYRQRGDMKKSEQLYHAAVREQPNNAEALARLGRALLENNKSEEGARYIEMALKENPACKVALKWKKQFNVRLEGDKE